MSLILLFNDSGSVNGTASPTGVAAASAVGTGVATGAALTSPSGVVAASGLGTVVAMGAAAVSSVGVSAVCAVGTVAAIGEAASTPAGQSATAAVGTATGSGAALTSPTGVSALSAVGDPIASGTDGGAAVATPAGVSAAASVGIPLPAGEALQVASGVAATAAIGQATAYDADQVIVQPPGSGYYGPPRQTDDSWRYTGPTDATAQPKPPQAVRTHVGRVTVSASATAGPAGVMVRADIGIPIAQVTIATVPVGVTAKAFAVTHTQAFALYRRAVMRDAPIDGSAAPVGIASVAAVGEPYVRGTDAIDRAWQHLQWTDDELVLTGVFDR